MHSILEFAWILPQGLGLAVGFVLVLMNWAKYPAASTLAFCGLCLIGLGVLSGLGMSLSMRSMSSSGGDIQSAVRISQMVGLGRTFIDALGTVLLVLAVFAGRRGAPQPYMGALPPFQK